MFRFVLNYYHITENRSSIQHTSVRSKKHVEFDFSTGSTAAAVRAFWLQSVPCRDLQRPLPGESDSTVPHPRSLVAFL